MLSLYNIVLSAISLSSCSLTLTSSWCHIVIIMSATSWILSVVFAVQNISATTSVSTTLLRIRIAIIARCFESCATQFDRKFLVILWCTNSNRFLHSLTAKLTTCMCLSIILSSWQSMMSVSLNFSVVLIICRCCLLSMSSSTLLILLSITATITSLQRSAICCCSWFKSSEQSLWCRHSC